MSDCAWVTDGLMDAEIICNFSTEVMQKILKGPRNENAELRDRAYKLVAAYRRGERVIDSDVLSDEVTLQRVTKPVEPPPPFFTNDYAFISDDLRAILEQFNLGQTAFKKVTLVNPFKKTRHPNYNILNVCEVKDEIDVENSQGLSAKAFSKSYYFTPTENDLMAVRKNAVEGAELWMDHTIDGAFFISDRLHAALKQAKLFKRPRFVRCRMV
jgi:hypothetical protein